MSRRGKGEGTLHRRKSDGRWVAQISVHDLSGRRTRKAYYGRTRAEAAAKLADGLKLHHDGQVKHLEYFGRFMEWHSKWTDKKRTLYHLTLYRWPFLKKLAEARHRRAKAPVKPETSAAETSTAAEPG